MTTTTDANAYTAAYSCKNCGGHVTYDIKSRRFVCESCRTEYDLDTGSDRVEEYRFADYRLHEQQGAPLSDAASVKCDNCGAEIYFDAAETATRCPMCGSPKVRTQAAVSGIAPEGIVPFRIDAQDAQERFRKWISKRWFAPNALKKAYAEGALEGLYVPFWTFDADARGQYSGRGGRSRVVRDHKGNTRTETDWYPVSGVVYQKFNDVLVCASRNQSSTIAEKLQPYDTVHDIEPFARQYLAGYKAERYSIDGVTCFRSARQIMERTLHSMAHDDILAHGFSQAQVVSFSAGYRDVTYKNVLLPMYMAQYGYGGKAYYYAINGQTGRVTGSYPKSPGKIAAVVALILALVMGLFAFISAADGHSGIHHDGLVDFDYFYFYDDAPHRGDAQLVLPAEEALCETGE